MPPMDDGDVTTSYMGLAASAVLYDIAVGAKAPGSDAHDALEVAIEMALVDKAGLIGRSGNGHSLSHPV